MARVVFFNIPQFGHVNPTLGLVKGLVAAGDRVTYYTARDFEPVIRATGAAFRAYPDDAGIDRSRFSHELFERELNLFAHLLKRCRILLGSGFHREIQALDPDYIIHDQLCPWGKQIAALLHLPAVCSVATFAIDDQTRWDYLAADGLRIIRHRRSLWSIFAMGVEMVRLFAGYRIRPVRLIDAVSNYEELNIVHTSRAFQPRGERFDERFVFVGPSSVFRNEEPGVQPAPESRGHGRPLIYISLGTLFNTNPGFYRACFEALGAMACEVVLSGGGSDWLFETFKEFPPNFTVEKFVPQLEVLKRADLFITHGGSNSISEAMFFEVPVIVVPQGGDSPLVGRRVAQLKTGLCIRNSRLNAASLKQAVAQILGDDSFSKNVRRIKESYIQAGGTAAALRAIGEFKKRHGID